MVIPRPGFRDLMMRFKDDGIGPDGFQSWAEEVAQALGQGYTLTDAPIAQGVAGTDTIVAAVGSAVIYVVSYVFTMSADGTVKFSDGTVDLTGAFDVVAKGGMSVIGQPSANLFKTHGQNRPIQIITTGGAARGHLGYFVR